MPGQVRPAAPTRSDISSRTDIAELLTDFYGRAFRDEMLGHVFVDVAQMNLEAHLPVICDFWQTVLFQSGTYRRNALRPHLLLHAKAHLEPAHFERWLELWCAAVDERHVGAIAETAKLQAGRIAYSMCRRITGRTSPTLDQAVRARVMRTKSSTLVDASCRTSASPAQGNHPESYAARRARAGEAEGTARATRQPAIRPRAAETERRTMTSTHIRQCPRCELRFTSSSELEDHLANDHRPRRNFSDEVAVPAVPPAPSHVTVPVIPPLSDAAATPWSRVRTARPWVLAVAGVLLIALVAWLAPTSTALITSALIVVLALCYRWRARVRNRSRG